MNLLRLIRFTSSLVLLLGFSLFASSEEPAEAQPQTKPNIVVFVADDMGWGDSATYGNKPDSNAKHGSAGSAGRQVYPVLFGVRSLLAIAILHSYWADSLSKWCLAALVRQPSRVSA